MASNVRGESRSLPSGSPFSDCVDPFRFFTKLVIHENTIDVLHSFWPSIGRSHVNKYDGSEMRGLRRITVQPIRRARHALALAHSWSTNQANSGISLARKSRIYAWAIQSVAGSVAGRDSAIIGLRKVSAITCSADKPSTRASRGQLMQAPSGHRSYRRNRSPSPDLSDFRSA